MQYYRHLDLDFTEAQQCLLEFCKENKSKLTAFWNNTNTPELLAKYPAIQKMFDPLGLHVERLSIIATRENSFIHVDHVKEKVRINIPILNCEHSLTKFFVTDKEPSKHFLPNGTPYYFFKEEDCTLVDSMCLNRPAALNVQELHQVVLTTPNVTRIACTISFKENIDHLLVDEAGLEPAMPEAEDLQSPGVTNFPTHPNT